MKKLIFLFCVVFFNFAYSQDNFYYPRNLGVSFNILGPIFGEYNLGLKTFLNP